MGTAGEAQGNSF